MMSRRTPADHTRPTTRDEAVATIQRLRAEITEQTKDMTNDEKEALVEELSRDIKAGMANQLRKKLDEQR